MPRPMRPLLLSTNRSLRAISDGYLDERGGLRSGIIREFYRNVSSSVRSSLKKMEYVLCILGATVPEGVERFLRIGGWELINGWLEQMQQRKMVASSRSEAVRIESLILDRIKNSPVVEERRENLRIQILRRLSRSPEESPVTRQSANEILAQWDNQNHEDSDGSSSSSSSVESGQSRRSRLSHQSHESYQSSHSNQAELNQDEEIDHREAYNFLVRLHRHINTVSFYRSCDPPCVRARALANIRQQVNETMTTLQIRR